MYYTTAEVESLIAEDVPYIDLTNELLGVCDEVAEIAYYTRENGVVSGIDIVMKMFQLLNIELITYLPTGHNIKAGDIVLKGRGRAKDLHTVWKIGQNVIDYASGIATMTAKMAEICNGSSRKVALLTTRKNVPYTKKIAIEAIIAGGAVPHRLGISETILIFKQHRAFFKDDEALEKRIRSIRHLAIEKKIVIEAESLEEAFYFSNFEIDAIQFDKLKPEALIEAVQILREKSPHLTLLAAGGINLSNIDEYVKTGVDGIVTTAPYYAKALDIGVNITPISENKCNK